MVTSIFQFADIADDERAAVLVLLDAVGLQLAQVTEVAHAQPGAADGDVDGERLAQGEGVARMCGPEIVVVVATVEEVVVTLSILRHESHTEQGQVGLVVEGERLLADVEAVVGAQGGGQAQVGPCLGGVVSIPVIIKEADIAASHAHSRKVEPLPEDIAPLAAPAEVVADASTHVVRCLCVVMGVGQFALGCGLEHETIVASQVAECLVQESYLRSLVLHGRQVGVEVVDTPDAEERGMGGTSFN